MGSEQDRPFNDPKHPSWSTTPGQEPTTSQAGDRRDDGGARPPAPYGPRDQYPGQGQYPGPPRHPESVAGYPAAGYPAAPPKTLSIVALVFGVVSVATGGFLLVPQLGAVVLGHIALRREPEGRAMAIAGLVMGYLVIGLWLLFIVVVGLFLGGIASTNWDAVY
ncbi:MAG: DUF4190 domain-containing protein [Arthrobacter sp.]|uniref:DUF4190 domain-containing protein n=1 Tax=Arthrobacter sp. TaxID=1667 RepID=UPI00348161AB